MALWSSRRSAATFASRRGGRLTSRTGSRQRTKRRWMGSVGKVGAGAERGGGRGCRRWQSERGVPAVVIRCTSVEEERGRGGETIDGRHGGSETVAAETDWRSGWQWEPRERQRLPCSCHRITLHTWRVGKGCGYLPWIHGDGAQVRRTKLEEGCLISREPRTRGVTLAAGRRGAGYKSRWRV